MSKMFEVLQKLWQHAEWAAPPFVGQTILPRLYALEERVMPYLQPNLDVVQLHGEGKGYPLTVTWIGLDYGLWYLQRVMFAHEPTKVVQAPVSLGRTGDLAKFADSDIVIVGANRKIIQRLGHQNALVIPLYVEHVLELQGNWEQVEKQLFKNNSVYEDFQFIKKFNYSLEPSRALSDLVYHYEDMYLPTMAQRHGNNAIIVSREEAQHHLRHGYLFFAKRDDQPVSGVVCRSEGKKLRLVYVGVAHGDAQLIKEGAVGALHFLIIRWAHEAGYEEIDFMGTPPYPRMGVFQNKRKWGTTISLPINTHKQVWIRIQRDTPAVRQFLIDNPFVVIDEQGELNGLVAVDDTTPITPQLEKRLHKQLLTSGMKQLRIVPITKLLKELNQTHPETFGTPSQLYGEKHDPPVPAEL